MSTVACINAFLARGQSPSPGARNCADFNLQHIDACLPITALKALEVRNAKFILQGQGLYCRLIDEDSGKLLAELKAFKRNNIHGFLILNQTTQHAEREHVQLVAWGGQSVRVIDMFHDNSLRTGTQEATLSAASAEFLAPDWILAGCASSINDEEQCAYLVTAHNALVGLHLVDGDSSNYGKTIHLQQLATGVKSILYSAHTIQISSSHILIAAGTVFGEIIVWSCFIDKPENLSCHGVSSIHHFFTGHEGSIFGVEMSPPIPCLNGNQTGWLLASCSDDRTIRIWDISGCEHKSAQDPSAYSTDGFELRSTGFGAVREIGSESCVAKAFGHVARIWGVHFMSPTAADQGKIRLVSRGEDAHCLVWDLTWGQSPTPEFQLCEVSSFHYHAGKHIFSLSMRSIDSGTIVYSGGADGAIKTFKIDENEIANDRGAATASHSAGNTKAKKEASLKAFDFVSSDCFIGTSVNGEVQLGWVGSQNLAELGMQPHISKEILCVEDDLRGYSVISSLPERGLALLGNVRGLIRLYNHENKSLVNISQTDQRPLKIFTLDSYGPSDRLSFVTSYINVDRVNLFTVTMREGSEPHIQNTPLCLLYPSEVQCASLICGGRYIALGFKNGSLAVYRVPHPGDSFGEPVQPLTSVRLIHGSDGTRYITPFSSQTREPGALVEYVLTCGRDGNYCVHEVVTSASDDSFHLQTVHRSSPAVSQSIEGVYFDKTSDDLMLYGFHGMDFVLWNESTQSEITRFFCGGARRLWAFYPNPERAGDGLFIWHQNGFNCRKIHVDSSRPLRSGGHGREIKSMEVFNATNNEGDTLFATGAEDTTVRLFAPIQPHTEHLWGTLKCLRVLKKHRAGLQQVGWSKNGDYLFTSAGYEEFFAWRIRWIPRFGIATLLVGVSPKEDPDSECRVTSFDTLEVGDGGDQHSFLIVLTFPNSVIKVSSPYPCFLELLILIRENRFSITHRLLIMDALLYWQKGHT